MIYHVLVPASVFKEVDEISAYYDSKQKGLGHKFLLDWELTTNLIINSPLNYQKKTKQYRSIQFKKFPYIVIFEVEEDKIYIYRLVHGKRNPKRIFKTII